MSVLAWKLRKDEVGARKTVTFHAPDAALDALARTIGVDRVLSCDAQFEVATVGDDAFDVEGHVAARVVQTCVVTLETFESDIREAVSVRFATGDAASDGAPARTENEFDEEGSSGMADMPEPIVGGNLDLGAVAQEFLALGVDPYPRKPGADFEPVVDEASQSPFAALAKLRGKGDVDN